MEITQQLEQAQAEIEQLKRQLHQWNDDEDAAFHAVVAQLGVEQEKRERLEAENTEIHNILDEYIDIRGIVVPFPCTIQQKIAAILEYCDEIETDLAKLEAAADESNS